MKKSFKKYPKIGKRGEKYIFNGIPSTAITPGILEQCFHTKHFDGRLLQRRTISIILRMWKTENVKINANRKLYKCPVTNNIEKLQQVWFNVQTHQVECPLCGDEYGIYKFQKIKRKDLLCEDCYQNRYKENRTDAKILEQMYTQQKRIFKIQKKYIIKQAKVRRNINNSDLEK